MIWDVHVHIGQTEKIPYYASFESYRREGMKLDVEKACAMPNISSITSALLLNHAFFSEHALVSGLFTDGLIYCKAGALVNPYDTNDPSFGKADFFKFHPSVYQTTASDERLSRIWAFGKPVIVHCGRNEKSRIGHVMDAARAFPDTTFIAAHLGGNAADIIETALDLIKTAGAYNIPNLYVDTSAARLPIQIKKAVSVLGADKVLFGSDVPYADLKMSIACVENADLPSTVKKRIFYGNAARVFSS